MSDDQVVSFTKNAASKVQAILAQEEAVGAMIRIGVKEGGCSGLKYTMDVDKDGPGADDIVVNSFGVDIVANKEHMTLYLGGISIDYVEALQGGGFRFSNSACGCGHGVAQGG